MKTTFSKLYKPIDVLTWKRKEHFEKWRNFDEPFHGIVVKLDLTNCQLFCDEAHCKVFERYMYHFVHALNHVEPMKYRLVNDEPVVFDEVLSGLVVMRPDATFAYGQLIKMNDFAQFREQLNLEKKRVIDRGTIHDIERLQNITHFSVLPWTDFIGLSHARNYGDNDSIPKITFGKITKNNGRYSMPLSIHVHHALVDGKDVADFINVFQKLLDENRVSEKF